MGTIFPVVYWTGCWTKRLNCRSSEKPCHSCDVTVVQWYAIIPKVKNNVRKEIWFLGWLWQHTISPELNEYHKEGDQLIIHHAQGPMFHDEIMRWECFPDYWAFARGIHWLQTHRGLINVEAYLLRLLRRHMSGVMASQIIAELTVVFKSQKKTSKTWWRH